MLNIVGMAVFNVECYTNVVMFNNNNANIVFKAFSLGFDFGAEFMHINSSLIFINDNKIVDNSSLTR